MGFRFRKSVKVGPMRVNFSKSGVGYSVGSKGFRVTKKANGGMRTTASIPGTGISYVKDYSAKTSGKASYSAPNPTSRPTPTNVSGSDTPIEGYCPVCYRRLEEGAKYCTKCGHAIGSKIKKPIHKRWWFILIIGLLCLRVCGAILGAKPTEQEVPTTESIIRTMETTVPTEAPTEAAPPTTDTTAPTEAEAESTTVATTEATTKPTTSGKGSENEIAYVLNTNTKVFHKPSCRHADKIKAGNRKERTDQRSSIINAGYKPCGVCSP